MAGSEKVIEISDPGIDVEEIMSRISERLRTRRAHATAQGLDYDSLVNIEPTLFEGKRLSKEVYDQLSRLSLVSDDLLVQLAMRDRHLPLFNRVFFQIEILLHKLVVKYVNLSAGRQIIFNRATNQALISMACELERATARIEALETKLSETERRVLGLEK